MSNFLIRFLFLPTNSNDVLLMVGQRQEPHKSHNRWLTCCENMLITANRHSVAFVTDSNFVLCASENIERKKNVTFDVKGMLWSMEFMVEQ